MPLTHPLSQCLLRTGEVPGNVLGPWDRVLGDDGLAGELGNRQASKYGMASGGARHAEDGECCRAVGMFRKPLWVLARKA